MNNLFNLFDIFPVESISWSIIHTFWMGLIVWLIYLTGKYFIVNSNSKRFYWAYFNLILLFIIFISNLGNEFITQSNMAETVYNNTVVGNQFDLVLTEPINNSSQNIISGLVEKIAPFIALVYLIGSIFMIMRFLIGIYFVNSLKRDGLNNFSEELTEKIQLLISETGLNKSIGFFESSLIDSPLTIGHFKPIILLPIGLAAQLSIEQVEAIFLHELAHIKRNDYLFNLIQQIVESILFFHPVTWILTSELKVQRENLCDDFCVKNQENPIHLAKALFEIEKSMKYIPNLALGAGTKNGPLTSRINRLFGKGSSDFKKGNVLPLFVIILVLGSIFGFNNKTESSEIPEEPETAEMPVIIETLSEAEPKPSVIEEVITEPKAVCKVQIIETEPSEEESISIEDNPSEYSRISVNINSDFGDDGKIELKTKTSDGRKIQIVFDDPQNIKSLKIDGKKIDEKDFDKYMPMLEKEVFANVFIQSDHSKNGYDSKDDCHSKVHYSKNGYHYEFSNDNFESLESLEELDELEELIENNISEYFESIDWEDEFEFNFDFDDDFEWHVENFANHSAALSLEASQLALDKSLQALELKKDELEDGLNDKELEKLERDMDKARREIERAHRDLEREREVLQREERRLKEDERILRERSNKMDRQLDEAINALKKDGHLKDDDKFELKVRDGKVTVNGKKLSEEESKKYIEILDIDDNENMNFIRN